MNGESNKLKFGIAYDFRNPEPWSRPFDKLYSEILDQIVYAEELGYDYVWLTEHHFVEDAYSPSIIPIAAAIASRTKKIRIASGIALLPFYNPVRLAEDCATVDIISGGRFELGVSVGYRVGEFKGFSIPLGERKGRTDEALDIIRRLWEGERVTHKSKYFEFDDVEIFPKPLQKPRIPIWVGGFVRASLRRAAIYGDGYLGGGAGVLETLYPIYVEELKKAGKPVEDAKLADLFPWLIASEDPEKTWNEAADHVMYQVNKYAEWFREAKIPGVWNIIEKREQLKQTGALQVAEPEGCVKIIKEYVKKAPVTHFWTCAIPPGLSPGWVEPHLKLFAEKVIPAFR